MQPQLTNHNPDMLRLWEAGYDMEFIGGQYLLVHQIPYVSTNREVLYGTIVCTLALRTPQVIAPMGDHTVLFIGETPCHVDGRPYNEIIINSTRRQLVPGIMVNFQFSSKPKGSGKYPDYYEKVRTYAEILSAPAKAIAPSVTSRPKKEVPK